ncbi:MAG: helicase, partial [Microvirga sp.]|nr:helicase [Microvirga sp.]
MFELIAAALGLAALFGGQEEKPPRSIPAPSPGPDYLSKAKRDEMYREALIAWRAQWEPTVDRGRWIPSGTATRIIARYPPPERPKALSPLSEPPERSALRAALEEEFNQHNQAFLLRQKERLKSFFDTVERNPLTDEQIGACVCMDDNLLVVAAAGSGKTSTMVAKAGYVLREGLATGDQILLLAFNTDAAGELAGRVEERLAGLRGADAITARTFHALGLEIIAKATREKPRLASWIGSDAHEVATVLKIVEDLAQTDEGFQRDWDLFRTVFGRDTGGGQSDSSGGEKPTHRTA